MMMMMMTMMMNIRTGLLVDCCCKFSSFSAVRIFQCLQCLSTLNFAAIQQSSRIFIGGNTRRNRGGGAGTPMPPWRRAWGRVETPMGGWRSGGGYAIAQQ